MGVEFGLDIGHGQNTFPETGSKGVIVDGRRYPEHSFNAQVAIKVKSILEAHGAIVHMAQKPYERDVSLRARSNFYNARPGIKLIASIHANAATPKVRGMCAFYYKGSVNGKKAADIYKKYVSAYGHILYSGGTADWGDFHMLRETNAPTILTENSFMTNPEDFKLIFQSKDYIQETAEINARTMLEYAGIRYISDDKPEPKPPVKPPVTQPDKPKEEKFMLEKAIVIYSSADYPFAELLANNQNCPIFTRKVAEKEQVAKEIFVVGGEKTGLKGSKFTVLSGDNRFKTAAAVEAYIRK